MKKKTIWKTIVTASAAITLMGTAPTVLNQIQAAQTEQTDSNTNTNSQSNNDKTLSSAYVVYGAGTSSEVRSQLNKIFGVDSSFKQLTATAADYNKYIANRTSDTTNAAMISSVAIAPSDPGSGVKVNIKNYQGDNNITEVTAQQYAMVAQMAGVTDVTIVVTANRPVSGESALTGVYEALAANGIQLNTQNTASANQMLNATQSAIDANKNNTKYPGQLMAAVGEVSKQISQQKQQNNGQDLATKQDIQDMLNKALAEHGIANETTNNQKEQITNALINFQNSPISADKSYTKNVDNTIQNVKNSTGNLMNKAKNWMNSKQGQAAAQEAKNWFERFIDWIKSLFGWN